MGNDGQSATSGHTRNETPPGGASSASNDAVPASEAILDGLKAACASARQVVSGFLELLSLEVRHAGLALMWMIAWGAAATILVVAAWLGFMAVLALWAVSLGLPWIPVIAGIACANVLVAALILSGCMKMSRHLLFAATRRQLADVSRRAT